jgi:hypothetical protein
MKKNYDRLKILKDSQEFISDFILYLNVRDSWKSSLENYEINAKIFVKDCNFTIVNEHYRESLTAIIDVCKIGDNNIKNNYTYCLFNIDVNGELSSNILEDMDNFFTDMMSIIRKHRISIFI